MASSFWAFLCRVSLLGLSTKPFYIKPRDATVASAQSSILERTIYRQY